MADVDLDGLATHANILKVGGDVLSKVELEYCAQREAAIAHAIAEERGKAEAELDAVARTLGPVASHAKQIGLLFGIEPVNRYENHLINTAWQARDMIEKVRSLSRAASAAPTAVPALGSASLRSGRAPKHDEPPEVSSLPPDVNSLPPDVNSLPPAGDEVKDGGGDEDYDDEHYNVTDEV